MRLIHVPFSYYPDAVGGTEAYVAALAAGLQRRGAEVLVAAPAEAEARSTHAGVPVRRFPLSPAIGDLRELYGAGDPQGAAAFGRLLDEEQPDLVHLHAFTRGVSLLTVREARRRGLPVVFTYHTPTVTCMRGTLLRWGEAICDGEVTVARCAPCALQHHGVPRAAAELVGRAPAGLGAALGRAGRAGGPWTALRMGELAGVHRAAVRALLTEVDAIVALCDWTRELLLRNGAAPQKLSLSRHGLDHAPPPHAAQPRPAGGPLRVAFLGRLDPSKGVDLLIAALRALPQAPLCLDIYGITQPGGEGYAEQLRRQAAPDPRIVFRQPVGGDAVARLLAGYDLLAVPSRVLETGPLVVLEAFAAGTPVLGARLGGIAELVTDGVDGLLVPELSPTAWRDALARLVAEPELLSHLRAGVRPPRHMEQVVDELLTLYESLSGPGARRATEPCYAHP